MDKGRYKRGAHTVTDFKYHFVWKTKYGHHVLKDEIALRLREIIREICAQNRMEIIKGNVRSNHIHILVRAPAHLSPAKMLQYLKGKSSYRLQREAHYKVYDHNGCIHMKIFPLPKVDVW